MVDNELANHQVLVALRKIVRAIDLHSRSLAQKVGLTGPQLIIMKEIVQAEEQLSIGQIAERVSLSSPTITNILDRLESKELVKRVRSNYDKRRVLLEITKFGEEIVKRAPSLLQEKFVNDFSLLQDWEKSLILSSLQKIAAMMEAKELDASPVLTSGSVAASAEDIQKITN